MPPQPARRVSAVVHALLGFKSNPQITRLIQPGMDDPRVWMIDEHISPFQGLRMPTYRAWTVVSQPKGMEAADATVTPAHHGRRLGVSHGNYPVLRSILGKVEHIDCPDCV